eukprot:scaffold427_cov263-Pinguiococcus_pyrenoidosus.AAC.16
MLVVRQHRLDARLHGGAQGYSARYGELLPFLGRMPEPLHHVVPHGSSGSSRVIGHRLTGRSDPAVWPQRPKDQVPFAHPGLSAGAIGRHSADSHRPLQLAMPQAVPPDGPREPRMVHAACPAPVAGVFAPNFKTEGRNEPQKSRGCGPWPASTLLAADARVREVVPASS